MKDCISSEKQKPDIRAKAWATAPKKFSLWNRYNLLESLESDEGIQMNPNKSGPFFLVWLGSAWIGFGRNWPLSRQRF
ncbi:MAG TPA: hypothetical protein VFE63_15585 [Roseiarcus sp.]|nr:hypothetical protein [Roseiarcus sp.]